MPSKRMRVKKKQANRRYSKNPAAQRRRAQRQLGSNSSTDLGHTTPLKGGKSVSTVRRQSKRANRAEGGRIGNRKGKSSGGRKGSSAAKRRAGRAGGKNSHGGGRPRTKKRKGG